MSSTLDIIESSLDPNLYSSIGTPTPNQNENSKVKRTLILAPPSIASHEARIAAVFATHDRASSTLHMLDRLATGLVTLPSATYDLVIVLAAEDALQWMGRRGLFDRLVPAMRPGATLEFEDGITARAENVHKEAIMAGLLASDPHEKGRFTKFEHDEEVVPLRFGPKKKKPVSTASAPAVKATNGRTGTAVPVAGGVSRDVNGKIKSLDMVQSVITAAPADVGLVDLSDDLDFLDDEDDVDLIDENDLLNEHDLKRSVQTPAECQPDAAGVVKKRRGACKDCTCGLAKRLQQKEDARRAKAVQGLQTLKLKSKELDEIDFTVKGKTGSCNSCSLGDAFRCEDCPYLGLPPFRPGEEVRILNNAVQL